MHLLLHVLGVDDVSGRWYSFWSGFGSDLAELALFGALFAIVRKHNCHVHKCWRVGRFHVEGTSFTVCRHHAPGGAPTHEHVLRRSAAWQRIVKTHRERQQ